MEPLRIPDSIRLASKMAWYLEPAKTALYIEYFGIDSGRIKVWNGTAWVKKPIKVWNGTSWVVKPVKRWNGTAWVATN